MPVSAIFPGLLPTGTVMDALQQSVPGRAEAASRSPDTVVFSSMPFRLLADLAVVGLQRLAMLLPTIEQAAVQGDVDPVPLAHLAKAAGLAARQVSDGHLALLAQGPDRVAAALPGTFPFRAAAVADPPAPTLQALARSLGTVPATVAPPRVDDGLRLLVRRLGAGLDGAALPTQPISADSAQRWLSEAKHLLRRADDALASTTDLQPRPDPAPSAAPSPVLLLPIPLSITRALDEVATARNEIAAALAHLGQHAPAKASRTTPLLHRLPEAASLLGFLLLLILMWLATETWELSAAVATLVGTGVCIWRICRATRGVRLDAEP